MSTWTVGQTSTPLRSDSQGIDPGDLLKHLQSHDSLLRSRAIMHLWRHHADWSQWIHQHASHDNASVRKSIRFVRDLSEFELSSTDAPNSANTEAWFAACDDKSFAIRTMFELGRNDILLGVLPAIATEKEPYSRKKLWQVVTSEFRSGFSEQNAKVYSKMIDVLLNEDDDSVRLDAVNRLFRDKEEAYYKTLPSVILQQNKVIEFLWLIEFVNNYQCSQFLQDFVQQLGDVHGPMYAKKLWSFAILSEGHGTQIATELLLQEWFRAALIGKSTGELSLLLSPTSSAREFLKTVIAKALSRNLAIDLVMLDQFSVFEPLMTLVPEESHDGILRGMTLRMSGRKEDEAIRVLKAFGEVKNAKLSRKIARRVCQSTPSKSVDVLVKYSQRVANGDAEIESELCIVMLNRNSHEFNTQLVTTPLFTSLMSEIERSNANVFELSLGYASRVPYYFATTQRGRSFIDAAYRITDPEARFRVLQKSLHFHQLTDRMTGDEINGVWDELLQRSDSEVYLATLFDSANVIHKLIALGHFDLLRDLADGKRNWKPSLKSRWSLYTHGSAIAQFRSRGEKASLLIDMIERGKREGVRLTLNDHDKADALNWILHDGCWERFSQEMQDRDKQEYLTLPGAKKFYIESRDLSLFIDSMDASKDDSRRRLNFYWNFHRITGFHDAMNSKRFANGIVTIFLNERDRNSIRELSSNPDYIDAVWKNGQIDKLIGLAKSARDDSLRSYYISSLHRSIQSAIRSDEMSVALERLSKLQDAKIGEVDTLLFAHLSGQGEVRTLKQAKRAGQELAWFDAIERFDWSAAKSLRVPDYEHSNNKSAELASNCIQYEICSRLNLAEERTALLGQILLCLKENSEVFDALQIACDSILANEERVIALNAIREHIPADSLFWFYFEADPTPAMNIVRKQRDDLDELYDRLANHAWYPIEDRVDSLDRLLKIGIALDTEGEKELGGAVLQTLLRYAKRGNLSEAEELDYLEKIAISLYEHGHRQEAWKIVSELHKEDEVPMSFFRQVYSDRKLPSLSDEAAELWRLNFNDNPEISFVSRLESVDRIVSGREDVSEIRKMLTHPFQILNDGTTDDPFKDSVEPFMVPYFPVAVFTRYGLLSEYRNREKEPSTNSLDRLVLDGRDSLDRKEYDLASDFFLRAWSWWSERRWSGPERFGSPFHLYMAGLCQANLDAAEGERTKMHARCLAFSPSAALELAEQLSAEGFNQDAARVFTDLMLCSTPDQDEYIAYVAAAANQSSDPDRAAHYRILRLQRRIHNAMF
ncbi:hypothetical protein [Novipirellula caenicola]